MKKEEIVAIKAMMYAFDRYGMKRLLESQYVINPFTENEVSMGFCEAYNICSELVEKESEETNETI